MKGEFSVFGQQIHNGAAAAIVDINAQGGVLGKTLRLVDADDGCRPERGAAAARDLVEQGAIFVVGHFCSKASIRASEVYGSAGTLQVTPASTANEVTERGLSTIFRVINRDDDQGAFAGTWLANTYAGENLAVIDDEQPYGRDLAEQTAKIAEAQGFKPALMGSFKREIKDYSDPITRLKAAKIDVVYIGGYDNDVGPFVRQGREQGFNGDFVSDDALNSSRFTTLAGPAADSVRFSDASVKTELASAKMAVAKFRAGDYPSGRYDAGGFTLNAYAAVQVFAAAAAGSGSADARKMADWLKANHVQTVIGDLSWDAKGDLKALYYGWFAWRGGEYQPLRN